MHKKHCYWFIWKRGHYLWSEYSFKLSPPNENGAELFSMIVPIKQLLIGKELFPPTVNNLVIGYNRPHEHTTLDWDLKSSVDQLFNSPEWSSYEHVEQN